MNAEYIIFMHFMEAVDKELEERLKKVLLDAQNADGAGRYFPVARAISPPASRRTSH